jgi:hypothetical protein
MGSLSLSLSLSLSPILASAVRMSPLHTHLRGCRFLVISLYFLFLTVAPSSTDIPIHLSTAVKTASSKYFFLLFSLPSHWSHPMHRLSSDREVVSHILLNFDVFHPNSRTERLKEVAHKLSEVHALLCLVEKSQLLLVELVLGVDNHHRQAML